MGALEQCFCTSVIADVLVCNDDEVGVLREFDVVECVVVGDDDVRSPRVPIFIGVFRAIVDNRDVEADVVCVVRKRGADVPAAKDDELPSRRNRLHLPLYL